MSTDLYNVLWVSKTATKEEIKKAYRRLAMKYHPDRNNWDKEAEAKLKEINSAYSILWDEQKRKQYDTFGSTWWPNMWWFWGFGWASAGGFEFDLWDIFESMFNWWRRSSWFTKKRNYSRWEDIEIILDIDLKTSIYWGKKEIEITREKTCSDCNGKWWTWVKTCSDCWWSGYVKVRQNSVFWVIEHTQACGKCNWAGETVENECETCHWKKRVSEKYKTEIDLPAGIDNNMRIRIEWEWNDGIWWAESWDLYVLVRASQSEKWLKRKDYDLYYDVELDVVEAVLWTDREVNIPILWKRNIWVKSGTQFWSVIKLSWDGIKYVDKDKKWDLFINLNIKVPKKLSKEEREAYENIAKNKKIKTHNKKWILESLFD